MYTKCGDFGSAIALWEKYSKDIDPTLVDAQLCGIVLTACTGAPSSITMGIARNIVQLIDKSPRLQSLLIVL